MTRQIDIAANGLVFPVLHSGTGPLVLLLHGFPDSPTSFARQIAPLAAAGWQVAVPTMRGYAPSALPADGDYHVVRMVEDVLAIADSLGAPRFHLVGHDWGATIAYAIAARAPERVISLAALAVPHPQRFAEALTGNPAQLARSAYLLAVQDLAMDAGILADGCAWLKARWRDWSPGWAPTADDVAELERCFGQPGVAGAALSWYRQALDGTSAAGAASQALLAGPFLVPTLGLVGADDGCIGADVFAGAMQPTDFPAGLTVETLAGAGHFLHREQPDAVTDRLRAWLAARQ